MIPIHNVRNIKLKQTKITDSCYETELIIITDNGFEADRQSLTLFSEKKLALDFIIREELK